MKVDSRPYQDYTSWPAQTSTSSTDTHSHFHAITGSDLGCSLHSLVYGY